MVVMVVVPLWLLRLTLDPYAVMHAMSPKHRYRVGMWIWILQEDWNHL
jgi:hypothetical protein